MTCYPRCRLSSTLCRYMAGCVGVRGSPSCPRYTVGSWDDSRKEDSRPDAPLCTDPGCPLQAWHACDSSRSIRPGVGKPSGAARPCMIEKALLGEASGNLRSLWPGSCGRENGGKAGCHRACPHMPLLTWDRERERKLCDSRGASIASSRVHRARSRRCASWPCCTSGTPSPLA